MNTVIPFRRKRNESDGDTDDQPIDAVFENLLFSLKDHGYWNPSDTDYTNAHMCLMFEAIQSYMDHADGRDHPLQKVALAIDEKRLTLRSR